MLLVRFFKDKNDKRETHKTFGDILEMEKDVEESIKNGSA